MQTTGGTNLKNVFAEISTDGTSFVDISGTFNALDISGGEKDTGETYTAEGDLPIVSVGKKKMTECKLKVVYTEGGSDAWRKFFDAYKNSTAIYFRYTPKGNASGNLRFTSKAGQVISPVYPTGDVAEAKVVLCELSFITPGFDDDYVP